MTNSTLSAVDVNVENKTKYYTSWSVWHWKLWYILYI